MAYNSKHTKGMTVVVVNDQVDKAMRKFKKKVQL